MRKTVGLVLSALPSETRDQKHAFPPGLGPGSHRGRRSPDSLHQSGAGNFCKSRGEQGERPPANRWCCVGACARCEKGRLAMMVRPSCWQNPHRLSQLREVRREHQCPHRHLLCEMGLSAQRPFCCRVSVVGWFLCCSGYFSQNTFINNTICKGIIQSEWGCVGESSYSCNLGSYVCILKKQIPLSSL